MKRFGLIILKVVATLLGLAVIFGFLWLLSGSSDYIIGALRLYLGFAKEHIAESAIFYTLFIFVMFVVEGIVNKLFEGKSKPDERKRKEK